MGLWYNAKLDIKFRALDSPLGAWFGTFFIKESKHIPKDTG